MKKNMGRKIFAGFAIMSVLILLPVLTGCESQIDEMTPMDFTYSLSEDDVNEMLESVETLEAYIDEGKNLKVLSAERDLDEKSMYIDQQYIAAQIAYYCDMENQDAYEQYVFAEESSVKMDKEITDAMEKLAKSNLPAKLIVFADWSDEEVEELEAPNDEISALEKEQNELVRQYMTLDEPESEEWSAALEEIYFKYVKSADELASLHDYDNYYDYAAEVIYMREYTPEQRESFREIVKAYLLPFWIEVDERYMEQKEQLTEKQKEQFDGLRKDSCQQSNNLYAGYVESFEEEMQTIMENLFHRDAVIYTESEDAYGIAFTGYSPYLDQPYMYLGNEVQDLLTLVHELGHYVAYYHFPDEELPYDTAEVHSQGNEWLMMQYLKGKLDEDVYQTFLLWRLRYGLDTVILSTIVDEYEEAVYKASKIESPDQMEEILGEILENYPNIEKFRSKEELYIYVQYVTMEAPVYYLNYATSELASMSFYSLAAEEGYEAAQEVFTDLCLETPTNQSFFDTLMDVGLPNPFEEETAKSTIEAFEKVLEEDAA